YITKQHETISDITNTLTNSQQQLSWTDIAIRNTLNEEDYNLNGGKLLTLPATNDGTTIVVDSVVDVMTGLNIFGKDLTQKLSYVNDDLATVVGRDCLFQSTVILSELRKQDDPHNPTIGIDASLIVGSNQASLNFPIISRQITQVFATDDTFSSASATEILLENGNLFITVVAKSRFEDDFSRKFDLIK
ncbi:MAG: hypothetical protein JHC54_15340, partial [Acinetobacter sp.]|nr:hypothetical protein [Acinetobacter sp.]